MDDSIQEKPLDLSKKSSNQHASFGQKHDKEKRRDDEGEKVTGRKVEETDKVAKTHTGSVAEPLRKRILRSLFQHTSRLVASTSPQIETIGSEPNKVLHLQSQETLARRKSDVEEIDNEIIIADCIEEDKQEEKSDRDALFVDSQNVEGMVGEDITKNLSLRVGIKNIDSEIEQEDDNEDKKKVNVSFVDLNETDTKRVLTGVENNQMQLRPLPGRGIAFSYNIIKHCKKERSIHPCKRSKKIFQRARDLTNHIRTHTEEKPFKCNLCSYATAQKSAIKGHMKTHECDAHPCNCGKDFLRTNGLAKHSKKCKIGQSKIKCDVCNKTFKEFHLLKRHKHKVHGEKPFKCDKCCYGTTQQKYLISHKKLHSKSKTKLINNTCEICGRVFRCPSEKQKHLCKCKRR